MDKLTPEQAKRLKLFSYYCRSFGAEEVNQYQYIHEGDIDYYENTWSRGFGTPIEGYPEILDTIKEIIELNEIIDKSGIEWENRGTLTINIDCKERKIKMSVSEYVLRDEASGDEKSVNDISDEDLKKELDELFKMMNETGFEEGVIEFNGGGDSGEVESTITFDSEFREDIRNSREIENFLYRWLSSFYGGWEINEGSHGSFHFFADGMIQLEFYEHLEAEESLGTFFYSEF